MEANDFERIPAIDPENIADTPEQAEQMRHDAFVMDIEYAEDLDALTEAVQSHYERGGTVVASNGEAYTAPELTAALIAGESEKVTRQYGLRDKLTQLQADRPETGEAGAEDVPDQAWTEYLEMLASTVGDRAAFNQQIDSLAADPEYAVLQPVFARLQTEVGRLEAIEDNDETFTEAQFAQPFRAIIVSYMQLPR